MSTESAHPLLPVGIHIIDTDVLDAEIVLDDDDDDSLPVILVEAEFEVVDRVLSLLAANCPEVYTRSNSLVRVLRPHGNHSISGPRIVEAKPGWLRYRISRLSRFRVQSRDGYRESLVPEWLAPMILALGHYPEFRSLRAVTETAVFLGDGQIHREGYDQKSGVLIIPRSILAPMPEAPTLEDAHVAMETIFEVACDFPFGESPSPDAHRAVLLAWILTIVARFAIDGPTPFLVVDACSQASGKGLLIDVGHVIAIGRPACRIVCSQDTEELRRAILPVLRDGRRVGWLDEVSSPFGGKGWNNLATAWPTYSDRVIRTSESPELPALTCWIVSANNLVLHPETPRRALAIRLEPIDERPEDRTGFRHPDLLAHVSREQPRLLAAALTILRAFDLAGRPRVLSQPIGSFEAWDAVIRQAVAWVSGHDPIAPRREMEAVVDQSRYAWRDVAEVLWGTFGGKHFTAKEALVALASPDVTEAARAAVEELLAGRPITPVSFARAVLTAHRGTPAGGIKLEVAQAHTNRGTTYRLVRTPTSQKTDIEEDLHG